MSQGDRKKIGIDRMQPILVDAEGKVWSATPPFFWMRPRQAEGNIVDYAVSNLGFIHIWPVDGSSIVVSLRPDLVRPKTMAGAFYAMADLRPVRVFISSTTTTKQRWELFNSLDRALNRIDRLVAAARRSSIGNQILRVWETLTANDYAHFRLASRGAAIARRRSHSQRAAEAPPPRRGKAAIWASDLAAAFLTRLDAVSSLSFA